METTAKKHGSMRWLIVVTSCAVSFINLGMSVSMGTLFLPIAETFGTSRPAAALVQSLTFGMMVCGVIVGGLVERYGLWKLCLAGTLLTSGGFGGGYFATNIYHLYIVAVVSGSGIATMFLCGSVAVGAVTEGRAKSISLAVYTSCVALGALVYPHLLASLTNSYGLNGTYLILSGICCNNIILVCMTARIPITVFRQTTSDDSLKKVEKNTTKHPGTHNRNPLTRIANVCFKMQDKLLTIISPIYVLVSVATVGTMSSVDGYIITCVDAYSSMDFTLQQGTTSLVIFQLGCFSAGIMLALLRRWCKAVNIYVINSVFCLAGSIGICLTYLSKYVHVSVAFTGAYLIGVADGVLASYSIILVGLVPMDHYGTAYGIILTTHSFTSTASGPISGAIRDATGSYAVVFLAIGTALLCCTCLFTAAGIVERRTKQDEPQLESPDTDVAMTFDNPALERTHEEFM